MTATFRIKLSAIVGAAAAVLVLLVAGSGAISAQRSGTLADVERRLVPKLELGQNLSTGFERLHQDMQDAVAAQDERALDATRDTRQHLFDLISTPRVLAPADAARLRAAIQKYDDVARDVSRRMIAGETGEKIVDDIATMQSRQDDVAKLVSQLATLNRSELASGFASLRAADARADRFRLAIGLVGLVLLLGLATWVGRSLVRAVAELSVGFARFGAGDFGHPIAVLAHDELGNVAEQANEMAAKLRRLDESRDRADWLKAGQVGLSEALRGDLTPEEVASRALSFLVGRVGAQAGAFFQRDEANLLHPAAHTGVGPGAVAPCRVGEDLPGRAAEHTGVTVLREVPPHYFALRSGLGSARPGTLVFVPLLQGNATAGVVELAFLDRFEDADTEFLESVRETLGSAIVTARSRAAQRGLLLETQQQAQRLAAQEEELRANNEELNAQQEELRRANEELEEQRRALSQKNQELERARTRVEEKADELARVSKYKSQFLANMSHELRTPLNSMLLLSHLLAANEGGNLSDKQVLHCKTIHSAGQDLLGLISQILDLARIESGRQQVDVADTPLDRFVVYARHVFDPLARDKGLQLEIDADPALPLSLATDAQRVERILTNLLGNAVKFTERGGKVALHIARPGPGTRFSRADLAPDNAIAFVVSDSGIGIAPEDQERIFSAFEQIESRTNRNYAGSGLGLAIARESAGLLGGELQLESTPGAGSVFTLYVPLKPPTSPSAAARPTTSPVADATTTVPRSAARLLVVEDDETVAEELADIIRSRGLDASVAGTGTEGLRLARELAPQGIILDVKLPDIDGWQVIERLRRDPATASIPVHFLSALDEASRGLSLGAVGYLTKPASRADLTAMVRTLSGRSRNARRVLVVEDDVNEGEAIVELLKREQLDAVHVTSAAAAIGALDADRFGCVILDLGLPDMNGLTVVESLARATRDDTPPILVHTGRALTRKETRELEAYANAVILKDGSSAARLVDEVRMFLGHVTRQTSDLSVPSGEAREKATSLLGFTILLAEDDMRTAYALSALLQGKGAEVVIAETGREALEQLEQRGDVSGVLMDVMMPEMDGYEAMRRIRRDRRLGNLPIVALTAKAMKGERERCIECGASDYLTKPVDGALLLAVLLKWLKPEDRRVAGP